MHGEQSRELDVGVGRGFKCLSEGPLECNNDPSEAVTSDTKESLGCFPVGFALILKVSTVAGSTTLPGISF